MNGKPLKSYNRNYNKKIAKIKSHLKKVNGKHSSKLIDRINENRTNYINNYLNQSISIVYKKCIEYGISKVIIGYNEGWKTGVNLGKKTNQKFVTIPHGRLRQKLENKLLELGIDVIMHEESYTSKCSFLDKEQIGFKNEYIGSRIKRGLFKTSKDIMINADVNGAGNIMRKIIDDVNTYQWQNTKVFSKKQFNEIMGSIISPIRCQPIKRPHNYKVKNIT